LTPVDLPAVTFRGDLARIAALSPVALSWVVFIAAVARFILTFSHGPPFPA
jgi:hypothetical protein